MTPPRPGGGKVRATSSRADVQSSRSVRARVRALPGGTLGWRIGVTLVGAAVVVIGVALLALPGPGWLIIFGGLGVLATEYEWARRLLRFARAQVRTWTQWVGRRPLWLRVALGLLTLVVVALLAWGVWSLTR